MISNTEHIDEPVDVSAAKLRQAYAATSRTAALNAVNATAMAIIVYSDMRHDVLLPWLVCSVVIALARAQYCKWALKTRAYERRREDWLFVFAAALSGGAWGVAGATFGTIFETASFYAIIFMIAGTTAGSVTSLAYYRPAFFAFTSAAIGPLVGYYFFTNEPNAMIMATILIIYFIGLGFGANTFHRWFVSNHEHKALLIEKISEVEAQADRLQMLASANEKAARRAEIALNAKNEFLAKMSHELRTPLNGILGAAQILRTKAADETVNEWVDIIHDSGENLLVLLNDILDLCKMEEGKFTITHDVFDLEDLFKSVIAPRQIMVHEKGVELTLMTDFPHAHYRSDGKRIRQILTNFVNNAIKFTEHGSITVTASVDESAGRPILRCCVKDTGCGLDAAEHDLIFERFTQIDNGISRNHDGAGLGLSICKELTGLLGGSINVESEIGKGSAFTFTIPLERVKDQTPERTKQDASRAASLDCAADNGAHAPKCLIVDDNPVNLMVIEKIVGSLGVAVSSVDSGPDALKRLSSESFDLILLDIHMPRMNGIETLEAIRESEDKNDQTPIIAVTADAMPGDREKFLAHGFDDYVPKPVKAARLAGVLKKYLDPQFKFAA